MRAIANKLGRLFLVVVLFVGFLGFASPASAGWVYVHGNSATLESPSTSSNVNIYGWGLQFYPPAGGSTWVHFSVPNQSDITHWIFGRIFFYLGSTNVTVTEINVYNGNDLLYILKPGSDSYDSWTGVPVAGWQTISFGNGAQVPCDKGMGISVRVARGTAGGTTNNKVIFSYAGASFF